MYGILVNRSIFLDQLRLLFLLHPSHSLLIQLLILFLNLGLSILRIATTSGARDC
jgi:hypothetical protein